MNGIETAAIIFAYFAGYVAIVNWYKQDIHNKMAKDMFVIATVPVAVFILYIFISFLKNT